MKDYTKAKFIAVMTDGSTDSSACEEELIFGRCCLQGDVKVNLIRIEPLEKGDAPHIVQAIENALEIDLKMESGEWKKKLVGITTDGASVNTGAKSGVVKRLQDKCNRPSIVGLHCVAHKLELAYKDAIQGNGCYRHIDTLLSGLYAFYHASPLRRSGLKAVYNNALKRPLMPLRIGGTRWIPHMANALNNFLRGYGCIVKHLEQVS